MLYEIISLIKKPKIWLIFAGLFLFYKGAVALKLERIALKASKPVASLFTDNLTGQIEPEVFQSCIEEYQQNEEEDKPLEYNDIVPLGRNWGLACDLNEYFHSFKVALFIAESAAVKPEFTLIYELIKTKGFTKQSKPVSCVFRAEALQAVCPVYIRKLTSN